MNVVQNREVSFGFRVGAGVKYRYPLRPVEQVFKDKQTFPARSEVLDLTDKRNVLFFFFFSFPATVAVVEQSLLVNNTPCLDAAPVRTRVRWIRPLPLWRAQDEMGGRRGRI